MKRILFVFMALMLSTGVHASWYWPFGSDDDRKEAPRLSEIMEPASVLIDEASDLAAEGKLREAVDKYRAVLKELDRIEMEYPERAQSPEFATVRNKRAYVNAAIDSMLLSMAQVNAKSVAVSDTSELEKRYAAEKAAQEGKKDKPEASAEKAKGTEEGEAPKADTPRARVVADLAKRDYEAAKLGIAEMLVHNANDPVALNLQAALEAACGDSHAAERTLDKAIAANPRDYHAYYNMVTLLLGQNPTGNATAKKYYETGRSVGGPVDAELEKRLK